MWELSAHDYFFPELGRPGRSDRREQSRKEEDRGANHGGIPRQDIVGRRQRDSRED